MTKSYREIEAVTKTVGIIKFLSTQKEPVSVLDIAQAVNMPLGTVACHLKTLEKAEYVRSYGNTFSIGGELARIWARQVAVMEGKRDRLDKEIKILKGEY